MEKITKEELMQKMNLSEDELVKITGGNIEDIKAHITEKCKKAKDGASNKCTEDYVIDRDSPVLYYVCSYYKPVCCNRSFEKR